MNAYLVAYGEYMIIHNHTESYTQPHMEFSCGRTGYLFFKAFGMDAILCLTNEPEKIRDKTHATLIH